MFDKIMAGLRSAGRNAAAVVSPGVYKEAAGVAKGLVGGVSTYARNAKYASTEMLDGLKRAVGGGAGTVNRMNELKYAGTMLGHAVNNGTDAAIGKLAGGGAIARGAATAAQAIVGSDKSFASRAMRAGAVGWAGYAAAKSVGRMASGRAPWRDKEGNVDIAGIPFV